jgi:hypothetical protein
MLFCCGGSFDGIDTLTFRDEVHAKNRPPLDAMAIKQLLKRSSKNWRLPPIPIRRISEGFERFMHL